MNKRLEHPDGDVYVEWTPDGKNHINVDLSNDKLFMPFDTWGTTYPVDLIEKILELKGPAYLCDEIMREESQSYVELNLRYDILSYLEQENFEGKRILDFACGSGASTCVLARMFQSSEIVGIELQGKLLELAMLRRDHYGYSNVEFFQSPDSCNLHENLGNFDYIVLSAVLEHLLPNERKVLIPKLWQLLAPGGILFIDQTPFRYFPIEVHTTHLPLINYFPSKLACFCANKLKKRGSELDWQTWLRRGIRGATVGELFRILGHNSRAILLHPKQQGIANRADLWFKTAMDRYPKGIKLWGLYLVRWVNYIPGVMLLPELALAIRKSSG